jgi:hypothetical protein
METTDIVIKTAAGADELKSRSHKLSPRLRTMLIMIDGSLSVGQLKHAAASLSVPGDFVEQLLGDGLIELVPVAGKASVAPVLDVRSEAERFGEARKLMNDTVVDALGIRAFFFTLKLEKCYTRADLLALLPDYQKAIGKGSGAEVAKVLEQRARDLLE